MSSSLRAKTLSKHVDHASPSDRPSLAFVVLVGRMNMAEETLQEFISLSDYCRESPIYAFYFPGSLSQAQIERLENLASNIFALPTTLHFPRFRESEMFYSRPGPYARRFGKGRIGYLDMCFWTANFFWEPALEGFDYILRFDDDSSLLASPDQAIREAISNSEWVVASAGLKVNVDERQIEVTENFICFLREFLKKSGLQVADPELLDALRDDDEYAFLRLPRSFGNFNLYRVEHFRTPTWYQWMYAVNIFGGFHRFRWGDIPIIGAYARLVSAGSHLDLGLVAEGKYRQNKPGTFPIRGGLSKYLHWFLRLMRKVWRGAAG